jgi:hypothetical protein
MNTLDLTATYLLLNETRVEHVKLPTGANVVVPAQAWRTMDVIDSGTTLNITFEPVTEQRSR